MKKCPRCGHIFDAHSNLEDKELRPKEGDISICIKCGSIAIFERNGLRLPSESELESIYKRYPDVRENVKRVKLLMDETNILMNTIYYCPRCQSQIPVPKVSLNPKGTFLESNCPKCGARIISDDIKNFLTDTK